MEFETKYITEKECEKLTTLSRPTRWRLARKGLFPWNGGYIPRTEGILLPAYYELDWRSKNVSH